MKIVCMRSLLANGIVLLLVMTLIFPILIQGYKVTLEENCFTNKHSDRYNNSWYLSDGKSNNQDNVNIRLQLSDNTGLYAVVNEKSHMSSSGPMNSSWPIICHDVHHTSQSQYSTLNNYGFEKWRLRSIRDGTIESSAVIDSNGTIYFGTMGSDGALYALKPDGTIIWNCGVGIVWSTPAIDENGIIYVSTNSGYPHLYAIYTNNGTLKWKYPISGTLSSPAITNDGTIVFGDQDNYNIIALYSNGTLKWSYHTDGWTSSSPSIADDGTIYCGSRDNFLYALYPNGTLRWRFATGGWIKGHPSIANDGTIYVPSFDGYLYALYPDGSLKWKNDTGGNYLAAASAAIASDGTLYVGTDQLRAFYPNGTVKWTIDPLGEIYGTSPAISSDGTIYVSAGQHLLAVNPDGTIKWRQHISNEYARSSPCIGEDGTVYVGSTIKDKGGYSLGYFHAFNQMDPDAPSAPIIDGLSSGKAGKEYNYTFTSISPVGRDVFYYVDWGDGYWTDWIGPYGSGVTASASHTWKKDGNYTISARSKDTDNLWGPWEEFNVEESNNPPDKPTINGPTICKVNVSYNFTFKATDPDENDLYYLINWGDGGETLGYGPFPSGQEITLSHKWNYRWIYIIKAESMDICHAGSDWETFKVITFRSKIADNMFFYRFLERFPLLERLLFLLK